jgi:hypothetical protein
MIRGYRSATGFRCLSEIDTPRFFGADTSKTTSSFGRQRWFPPHFRTLRKSLVSCNFAVMRTSAKLNGAPIGLPQRFHPGFAPLEACCWTRSLCSAGDQFTPCQTWHRPSGAKGTFQYVLVGLSLTCASTPCSRPNYSREKNDGRAGQEFDSAFVTVVG